MTCTAILATCDTCDADLTIDLIRREVRSCDNSLHTAQGEIAINLIDGKVREVAFFCPACTKTTFLPIPS